MTQTDPGLQCVACGYSLSQDATGRCPECGRVIETPPTPWTPGAPLAARVRAASLGGSIPLAAWACVRPRRAFGADAKPGAHGFARLPGHLLAVIPVLLLALTLATLALGSALGMVLGMWRARGAELLSYLLSNILVAVYDGVVWVGVAAGASVAIVRTMGWRWPRRSIVDFATFLLLLGMAGEFVRRLVHIALSWVSVALALSPSYEAVTWTIAGIAGYACFVVLAMRALCHVCAPRTGYLIAFLVACATAGLVIERIMWPWWYHTVHRPVAALCGAG